MDTQCSKYIRVCVVLIVLPIEVYLVQVSIQLLVWCPTCFTLYTYKICLLHSMCVI